MCGHKSLAPPKCMAVWPFPWAAVAFPPWVLERCLCLRFFRVHWQELHSLRSTRWSYWGIIGTDALRVTGLYAGFWKVICYFQPFSLYLEVKMLQLLKWYINELGRKWFGSLWCLHAGCLHRGSNQSVTVPNGCCRVRALAFSPARRGKEGLNAISLLWLSLSELWLLKQPATRVCVAGGDGMENGGGVSDGLEILSDISCIKVMNLGAFIILLGTWCIGWWSAREDMRKGCYFGKCCVKYKFNGGVVISLLIVFWDGSIVSLSNYFCSSLVWYYLLSVLTAFMVFSAVKQLPFCT